MDVIRRWQELKKRITIDPLWDIIFRYVGVYDETYYLTLTSIKREFAQNQNWFRNLLYRDSKAPLDITLHLRYDILVLIIREMYCSCSNYQKSISSLALVELLCELDVLFEDNCYFIATTSFDVVPPMHMTDHVRRTFHLLLQCNF